MTQVTSNKLFPIVQELILKHFQLDVNHQEFIKKSDSWECLHTKLCILIQDLLQHHFEKLLQILYLVDVQEQDFKEIMQTPDLILMADRLATLILEREIQKAQFRCQYHNA